MKQVKVGRYKTASGLIAIVAKISIQEVGGNKEWVTDGVLTYKGSNIYWLHKWNLCGESWINPISEFKLVLE